MTIRAIPRAHAGEITASAAPCPPFPPPVRRREAWLIVELGGPHQVLSWALVGGGLRSASTVAWREVRDADLSLELDAERFLAHALAEAGMADAVGLMTSRALDRYVVAERRTPEAWARCIATVGLGNALRAGDPPPPAPPTTGTINLLCQLSIPLSENALLEALSIATEARTAALLDAALPSQQSPRLATGTGTDCTVIAAPSSTDAHRARFAGKHTLPGHLIGAAVYEAVTRGAAAWKQEHGL